MLKIIYYPAQIIGQYNAKKEAVITINETASFFVDPHYLSLKINHGALTMIRPI